MTEAWKVIDGYDGYEVSSLGRVRSTKHTKAKILSQRLQGDGYLKVQLCRRGKKKDFLVHRLVAKAFVENPSNLPQVNHRNEDKSDNWVENLEWCDNKYNTTYSIGRTVLQYSLDGRQLAAYPSTTAAALETGAGQSHICKCCRGRLKSAGGYVWRYA